MLSLRLALCALGVAAIVFAYQLGAWRGGQQGAVKARQQQVFESADETAALQDKNNVLQTELDHAAQELAINQTTIDELKKELIKQGHLNFDESRELSLYRQIENSSNKSGLAIDSLKITRDDTGIPQSLMFTLLQYQGKGRAEGTFSIRLNGLKNAEAFQQVLTDASSATDMPFDLRFFESFSIPLNIPKDVQIDTVEISLTPTAKTHNPTKNTYPWNTIATY